MKKAIENDFNIIIPNESVAVVFPPKPWQTSKIKLTPEAEMRRQREAEDISEPCMIVKVGKNASSSAGIDLKEGDYVFLHSVAMSMGIKISNDVDKNWLNPIIIPGVAIAAVLENKQAWEEKFNTLIEKVDVVVEARREEARLESETLKAKREESKELGGMILKEKMI